MIDFRKKKKTKTESVSENKKEKAAPKRRKFSLKESIIDEAAFDDALELANAELENSSDTSAVEDSSFSEEVIFPANPEALPDWEPEFGQFTYDEEEAFNELYALKPPTDEELESFLLIHPSNNLTVDDYLRSEFGSEFPIFEAQADEAAEYNNAAASGREDENAEETSPAETEENLPVEEASDEEDVSADTDDFLAGLEYLFADMDDTDAASELQPEEDAEPAADLAEAAEPLSVQAEPEPEQISESEPVVESEPIEEPRHDYDSILAEFASAPDGYGWQDEEPEEFDDIPAEVSEEPKPVPEPEPVPEYEPVSEPEPLPEPEHDYSSILSEFASAPDGYAWQDESPEEFEDIKAEVNEEIFGTVQKSAISAMEQEARDYIARVRSKASAPAQTQEESSDDYGYGVDIDSYFAEDADPTRSEKTPKGKYVGRKDEPEIDSRFNLGGKVARRGLMYGTAAIDQSADSDYVPKEQTEYSLSQWTAAYDDIKDAPDEEALANAGRKASLFDKTAIFDKVKIGKRKKKKSEQTDYNALGDEYSPNYQDVPDITPEPEPVPAVEGFDDNSQNEQQYASQFRDYPLDASDGYPSESDSPESDTGKKFDEEDMYFPPSFGEYVASLLASVFFRLKGYRRGDNADTMVDAGEEDLGAELSPTAASTYYNSFINAQRLRLRIAAGLLAILLYLSLELPVPGMLKYIPVTAAACFALQSAIMLLALDIVTKGILNFIRLRIGADSMAVFSCLLTGADALIVALSKSANLHLPLCAVSSVSIVGLMLASHLSTRGLRKAIRVPAIGQQSFAVTSEIRFKSNDMTLLKSLGSAKGFVRRSEEAAPDETFFSRTGMFAIPVCLLLALIIAVAKKSTADTVYVCSAVFAPAVPFTALLGFAMPFFFGSNRLFKSGAAIAGWSGVCDIGASKNLIITDRDLFPESCVHLTNVRIFADGDAKQVISYAGSMISVSGSTAAGCFGELMKENDCEMKQVTDFEYLSGGGMKAMIEGHSVLCGSTDFMRLMTIRIPYRLTDRTTVLLAIDGILFGIFSLDYEAMPQIRKALVDLVRSNRHPVFAVRDFNINPEMLHNAFDLPTDGYDFPPFVERFELAEPGDRPDKRISAILCNEGLGPLTKIADLGHSMYLVIMANLVLTILAAVLGVGHVVIKLLTVGAVSIGSIISFMLLFTIPVIALSIYISIR